MAAGSITTKVSTKGQIILPKAIRAAVQWPPGTQLSVEQTDEGVLRRAVTPAFPPTTMAEVYGCLAYAGPPRTIEEMDAAVLEEAKRRHAGD